MKVGIVVMLEAKPGKEAELADFLRSAQPLAEGEPFTRTWYSFQLGPTSFGIFDTFDDQNGRQAHLSGPIAAALMSKTPDLLSQPPDIRLVDLLGVKAR